MVKSQNVNCTVHYLKRWLSSLGGDAAAGNKILDVYPELGGDDSENLHNAPHAALQNMDSEEGVVLAIARRLPDLEYIRTAVELEYEEHSSAVELVDTWLTLLQPFDSQDTVKALLHESLGLVLQASDLSSAVSHFDKASELLQGHPEELELCERHRWASCAYNSGLLSMDLQRLHHADRALRTAFNIRSGLQHELGNQGVRDIAVAHDAIGQLRQEQLRIRCALGHHKRAVRLLRIAVRNEPDLWAYDLAGALNNLGQVLRECKEAQKALATLEESLSMYESLAESEDDIFAVDLSMAYHNVGQAYGDMGSLKEARCFLDKALHMRRTFVDADVPDAQEELASTLESLGEILGEHREFEQAERCLMEALDIQRQLAQCASIVFDYDLCRTLLHLADLRHEMSQYEAAASLYDEVLGLYQNASVQDERMQAALATAEMNASVLFREMEQFDRALTLAQTACDTFRQQIAKGEGHLLDFLATALNNVGLAQHAVRQVPAARISFEESERIVRDLMRESPEQYRLDLGRICLNLAMVLRSAQDPARALDYAQEAFDTYADLAGTNPGRFLVDEGNAAMNLAIVALERADNGLAEKMFNRALTVHEALAEKDREVYRPTLALTLLNQFSLYAEQEREAEVEHNLNRSLALYAQLIRTPNAVHLSNYALTHANAGVWYERHEEDEKAFAHYRCAVALCQQSINLGFEFVRKGDIPVAYRRLLSQSIADPAAAFGYAAALLDAGCCTGVDDSAALKQLCAALAFASVELRRECVVLVPISDIENEQMTLGLITARDAQWYSIPCIGWSELALPTGSARDVQSRERISTQIWHSLPEQIQQAIHADTASRCTVLVAADPTWCAFPWELIRYQKGRDGFLGLYHAFTRIESLSAKSLLTHLQRRSLGTAARQQSVVFAAENSSTPVLKAALEEARTARQVLQDRGVRSAAFETGDGANIQNFRTALTRDPDIVYFCGHGTVIDNEELLEMGTPAGQPRGLFGAYELDQLAAARTAIPLFSHAPLFVLSSCSTGARRVFGGRREDLVGRLLHHGAGAVIATALPVDDVVAARFGERLLKSDRKEEITIASRVVAARRELALDPALSINSFVWGAWAHIQLHGSPNAVLFD